jgi:prophage antirepressor-like protein
VTTEIQVFDVVGTRWRWGSDPDGTPWAVLSDVAKGFDHRDARDAARILDEDEKGTRPVRTPGGTQQMLVVFEDGLWELIFRSAKPEAKAIKKRVKEILRGLRAGDLAIVPSPRRELSRRDLAEMVIAEADRADAAEALAAELAPAAQSWNVLASGDGDYSVGDAAKILSRDPAIKRLGRDRLFTVLDEANWIYRAQADGRWRAYQTAINAGRLSELPQSHYHPKTGDLVLDPPQVRVTAKGLADLRTLLGGSVPLSITDGSEQ